jgi:hypothetical protein
VTLTAFVVQAAKQAGLQPRWAPLAALIAATMLAALAELIVIVAWLAPVARIVTTGLVLGLASSGGYSWAKQLGKEQ